MVVVARWIVVGERVIWLARFADDLCLFLSMNEIGKPSTGRYSMFANLSHLIDYSSIKLVLLLTGNEG